MLDLRHRAWLCFFFIGWFFFRGDFVLLGAGAPVFCAGAVGRAVGRVRQEGDSERPRVYIGSD